MNDSFRTNVFVRFCPETIACACIYLAARHLLIALPNNPPWYGLFGATESNIHTICRSILKLYTRRKPNAEELEKTVNELKKQMMDAKLKSKEPSAEMGVSPTTLSRTATPEKSGNFSPLIRPDVRRLKSEDEKSDSSFGRDVPRLPHKRRRSRSRSNSKHKRRSLSRSPVTVVARRPENNSSTTADSRSRHDKDRGTDSRVLARHTSSSDIRKSSPSSNDIRRSKKPARAPSPSRHQSPSASPEWTASKRKRSKLVSSPVVVSKSHKRNGHRRHRHSRSKERRVHTVEDRHR